MIEAAIRAEWSDEGRWSSERGAEAEVRLERDRGCPRWRPFDGRLKRTTDMFASLNISTRVWCPADAHGRRCGNLANAYTTADAAAGPYRTAAGSFRSLRETHSGRRRAGRARRGVASDHRTFGWSSIRRIRRRSSPGRRAGTCAIRTSIWPLRWSTGWKRPGVRSQHGCLRNQQGMIAQSMRILA